MWEKGTMTVLAEDGRAVVIHYCMKHFEEPSCFGIDEGRISKLTLTQDGEKVYNYDRGLDIEPETAEAEMVLKALLEKYNGPENGSSFGGCLSVRYVQNWPQMFVYFMAQN